MTVFKQAFNLVALDLSNLVVEGDFVENKIECMKILLNSPIKKLKELDISDNDLGSEAA